MFLRPILAALLLFGSAACNSAPPATDVSLPVLFSDHMVIQRDQAVPVWGKASPGGVVTVHFQDLRAEAIAAPDSSWRVMLAPKPAGGPYTLQIAGQDTLVIDDVLVGDVWIGSGQSNMQWAVEQSDDADIEIAAAHYPDIRLFSVERTVAARPQTTIPSDGWHRTTPEAVRGFSAVAYYFGRSLHDSLDVPIGLIHSSWGGTVAEAWTSAETLSEFEDFQGAVAELNELTAEFDQGPDAFQAMQDAWLNTLIEMDSGYSDGNPVWAGSEVSDADWPSMTLPALWEEEHLPGYDGIVWFRTSFDLPPDWQGKDLNVHIGKIDDNDITWFNGVEIGRISGYNRDRVYPISADLLNPGRNTIAVRVMDTGGGGGIWGEADELRIEPANGSGNALSLAGAWRYNTALTPEQMAEVPPPPTNRQNTPTVLFNAMIHPLIPYQINGVIWYQGESNAGRAYQYRTLFPALINDWRTHWNNNFDFHFVQLANFREEQKNPSEEETWPELREAQTMALSTPGTGMAVIIDIGEADDIHPTNKQDVGARLARAALHVTYGREDVVAGGPLFSEMAIEGDVIRLSFDQVGAGLVTADGEAPRGFAVAGDDQVFHWAEARIEGEQVLVSHPDIDAPVAVRYGWADNPVVTLYNVEGLPASPFRTDDWPGITE